MDILLSTLYGWGGWDHGAGELTSKQKLDNLGTFILASFFSKKTTLPDKGIRFAH